MFRGVQHINIDAKGRMAMPAKHRERLLADCAGQLVATVDPQSQCLLIYPMPEWEQVERQVHELPSLQPASRRFKRMFLGYASDLEFDGNGRLLIPPSLREIAGLDKKAVLAGQGNKFELWSEDLWMREHNQWQEDVGGEQQLPDEMLSLSL